MSLKKGESLKIILKSIGAIILLAGIVVAPGIAVAYGMLERQLKPRYRSRLRKNLYNLRGSGYIDFRDNNIILTKKGYTKFKATSIDDILLSKQKKWDGIWRVVIFDIPETRAKQRRFFSYKCKELGMKLIQDSVYLYPFPCEKEIGEISQFMYLDQYIQFIEARSISNDKDYKKSFGLI